LKTIPTYEQKEGEFRKELLRGYVMLFFSDVLSEIYDLSYEDLDQEQLAARDAWITKNYMDWMEKKGLDAKVLVFDSEEKGIHIVPYVMGFTVDFTFKHLLEKDQEEFTIATIGDYISLGYQVEDMSIFSEFPEWIDSFYPPKSI
jgi:hypothetical protein